MPDIPVERIKQIISFPSLVKFLRDELNWQLDANDIEDLTYDYDPEELGLSEEVAQNINEIKQLRPFSYDQPWGIFYLDFEPKRLPVVVLRLILQKLKIKKKATSGLPNMRHWELNDLLFISSYGPEDERSITFAHFNKESEDSPPVLRVISWDTKDAPLHLERCLTELQHLKYEPYLSIDQWREKWVEGFVLRHRHSITTSKALAKKLADLAKDIRDNCQEILQAEKENGPFHKTLKKFKEALIHDLTEDDFADMYAQTIAYGLLYTAIRSHVKGEGEAVSAEHVQQLVLPTNPFLKEVMEVFFNIGSRRWDSEQEKLTGMEFDELGVNEIISTLKDEQTDFDAILRDFGNKNPNEDPVIHFYELFLKEYDKQKRKSRGVYYTPRPVVSFIVRSIHELLKKDFGLEYGLADTSTWGQMIEKNPNMRLPDGVDKNDFFVQILDPALGTGTFLVETIDIIHKTIKEAWGRHGLSEEEIQKLWNEYVPEKLLPRLYGFELMMAPYAIAHMKIGIKLFETGYQNFQQDNQRVRVYLTNTLEAPVDTTGYLDTLDPAMAEETRQANGIKKINSITIIIGNPPYAGHSFNASKIKRHIEPGQSYETFSRKQNKYITKIAGIKGATEEKITWIGKLIQPYFFVDDVPLGERNPKWLNDDYVKFIRYAQYRLDITGTGILGFITNHRYLNNPTFRGMRQQLIGTFSDILITDLHGNSLNRETCPDGSIDKNVFDIQQGVSIGIFAKGLTQEDDAKVFHIDLWGERQIKYDWLQNNDIKIAKKNLLKPKSNTYEFSIIEDTNEKEYKYYIMITEVLPVNSVGILTHRDSFAWDISQEALKKKVRDLCSKIIVDDQIKDKYSLDNKIIERRAGLKENEIIKSIKAGNYRVFDKRYVIYHRSLIDRGRWDVVGHLIRGGNLAVIAQRQTYGLEFYHAFCTNTISDLNYISNLGGGSVFPLYLYPVEGELNYTVSDWPAGPEGRTPNLDPKFVKQLADAIGLEFVSDGRGDLKKTFGPEDIFNYIYGIFHSPVYRERYAEFLKRDFPRVPITSDTDMFEILYGLGDELVALHLMESDKLNDHITTFPVSGDNAVSKVGEKRKALADVQNVKGKLFINKTQYFDGVPEEVWNFHIGGYQVCYKWLADRKKACRKLSAEDIDHYHKIVVAINETIKIMKQIDETIAAHGGWPIK